MTKRILVTGSREFEQFTYEDFREEMYYWLRGKGHEYTLINGGAKGIDSWCTKFAVEHGIEVIEVQPDWERYGRSAAYRRNEQMAKMDLDGCLGFCFGDSRGTRHQMRTCGELGVRVVDVMARRERRLEEASDDQS